MSQLYQSAYSMPETLMLLCYQLAQARSKDPNTKVGACVYDPVTGGLHLGYNGLLPGVPDLQTTWDDRQVGSFTGKYARVIHAERNAVTKAVKALAQAVDRCQLFCTHYPCHVCLRDWIAQFGIRQVFYGELYPQDELTPILASEAHIELIHLPVPSPLR